VFPEIDLSADGDLAKSVSRRHARILKQRNKVLVEDLGSINGTFINGKKLVPYLPETLSDGDLLQLGKLPVEIRIYTQ
jgi:pSer/pThr/pTyr-binding forkhead associated (FHA) protein